MTPDQWKTSLDLGTLATAALIVAVAVFLWASRGASKKRSKSNK